MEEINWVFVDEMQSFYLSRVCGGIGIWTNHNNKMLYSSIIILVMHMKTN